jgi:hypothetical protein
MAVLLPQVYRMLVVERGWSDLGYGRWLAQALTGSLLR